MVVMLEGRGCDGSGGGEGMVLMEGRRYGSYEASLSSLQHYCHTPSPPSLPTPLMLEGRGCGGNGGGEGVWW